MEDYIVFDNKMNKKSLGLKCSRNERLTSASKFKPYRETPFSPDRLFTPQLNYQREPSSAKIRMRKIASRQIQDHFETRHVRYRSKENQHFSSFKKKAKKNDLYEDHQSQLFWVDKLASRMKGLKQLNEQYLAEVTSQLERRKEWLETQSQWNKEEKIINQYNIIYEYRANSLPVAYLI